MENEDLKNIPSVEVQMEINRRINRVQSLKKIASDEAFSFCKEVSEWSEEKDPLGLSIPEFVKKAKNVLAILDGSEIIKEEAENIFVLNRPIVFLDLETTGIDPAVDRIIEIAMIKIGTGREEVYSKLVNPGVVLKEEIESLTGIKTMDLASMATFRGIAAEVHEFIKGCDVSGFRVTMFDVPLLWEEFFRAGIEWDLNGVRILDSANIFHRKNQRTLGDAVQFYLGRGKTDGHRALGDARDALEVLIAQQGTYPELKTVEALAEYSQSENRRVDLHGKIVLKDGVPVYNIGKAKGVPVNDDPGFGRWMLTNNFPAHTQKVLRDILFPVIQTNLI